MGASRWTISDRERARFASYSGDHNPIHTDPIAARRMLGGRVLVHGAHLALRVLGQAAARLDAVPERVHVTFRRGVRPDAELTTTFEVHGGQLRAVVSTDDSRALDITITPGHGAAVSGRLAPTSVATPVHHTLDSLVGARGELELTGDERIACELFPAALELLGSKRVAELATLSRVVGMHAPGLHSMSSRYEIRLLDRARFSGADVAYQVRDVDPRLRRVEIDVAGPTQQAHVTAFALPEPIEQRDLADIDVVSPTEFSGIRALVVGGSRGLGAATVRLLAAGGADVRFTYDVGGGEAQQVSSDTGATALEFDVQENEAAPRLGGWSPTHLLWFAAPVAGDAAALEIQVDAFERAFHALASPPLRAALWPSCADTGAVQLAGERRCAELAARKPGVAVHAPRLPMMATDRTLALLPTEYADTTTAMLDALRAVTR